MRMLDIWQTPDGKWSWKVQARVHGMMRIINQGSGCDTWAHAHAAADAHL